MDKKMKVGLMIGSGLIALVVVVLLLNWWRARPAEMEQQASRQQAEELYQPPQESPAPEPLSAEVHPGFLQDNQAGSPSGTQVGPVGSAATEQAVLPPAVANTEESAKSNTFVMDANQRDMKDSSVAGTQLGPVSPAVSQPAESDFVLQAPAPQPQFHVVRKGDTLYDIAAKFYGPKKAHLYKKILEANRDKISNANILKPGTKLLIPSLETKQGVAAGTPTGQEQTYVVKAGDTLSDISLRKLGTSKRWREIMTLNGLSNEYIKAGMVLKLPPLSRETQPQLPEVPTVSKETQPQLPEMSTPSVPTDVSE